MLGIARTHELAPDGQAIRFHRAVAEPPGSEPVTLYASEHRLDTAELTATADRVPCPAPVSRTSRSAPIPGG